MIEAAVLVEDPSAGAAHAHRGEDEVGSGKRLVDVRRRTNGGGVREVQRGKHGHHRVEPTRIGVVQDDAVDVEGGVGSLTRPRTGQDVDHRGDPEAPSSDDGELHGGHPLWIRIVVAQ